MAKMKTETCKAAEKLSESSYVLVVDTFHEHQFSVGPFCVSLILEGPAQLLDGDVPLQVVVVRWTVAKNESKSLVNNNAESTCYFNPSRSYPVTVCNVEGGMKSQVVL